MKLLYKIAFIFALALGTTAVTTVCSPDATAKTTTKKKGSSRKSSSTKSQYTRYTGTIGKYKATVFLKRVNDSDVVEGYYYYGNGAKGNLKLRGHYGDACGAACVSLSMTEYDSKGNATGYWNVDNVGMTTNPGERVWCIMGTMTTAAGKTYEVEMW